MSTWRVGRSYKKIKTLRHLKHIVKHCMINQKNTF